MAICIGEMQVEMDELLKMSEKRATVELAEKQRIIDSKHDEVERQKQQLNALLQRDFESLSISDFSGPEPRQMAPGQSQEPESPMRRFEFLLDTERKEVERLKIVVEEKQRRIERQEEELDSIKLHSNNLMAVVEEHRQMNEQLEQDMAEQ